MTISGHRNKASLRNYSKERIIVTSRASIVVQLMQSATLFAKCKLFFQLSGYDSNLFSTKLG